MTKRVQATVRMPARNAIQEARARISMLRGCRRTINVVLIAPIDGVQLQVWADGSLRRRARLRDGEARKPSQRLSARLVRRGYHKGLGTS